MTATSIESMDGDLASSREPADDVSISAATLNQSRQCLLCESALGQWMLTRWSLATHHNSQFILDGSQEIGQLVGLAQSHAGRVLVLLPTGRVKGAPRQSAAMIRDRILKAQLEWPGLPVEPTVALYCVDAHPFGLPKLLYPIDDGAVTTWSGFRAVVSGLMGILGTAHVPQGELARRMDSISTILFELFKNTHDHARTGAQHEIVGHSVRGLYARYYARESLLESLPKTRDELLRSRLNPAEQYAWSVLQPTGPSDALSTGLLELSVFDAGPGLAARWYGRDTAHLPVQEELNFVLSCLTKGQTTSSSPARGFGLWNVLQQLRALGGFVRIRTNRVHAYREFDSKRDAALKDEGDLKGTPKETLFDWKRAVVTTPSDYPMVQGTLISVLLPLSSS